MNRRQRAHLAVKLRRWPIGVRVLTRVPIDGVLVNVVACVVRHAPEYAHACAVSLLCNDAPHVLIPFRLMRRMHA